jgi:hypothetical protein
MVEIYRVDTQLVASRVVHGVTSQKTPFFIVIAVKTSSFKFPINILQTFCRCVLHGSPSRPSCCTLIWLWEAQSVHMMCNGPCSAADRMRSRKPALEFYSVFGISYEKLGLSCCHVRVLLLENVPVDGFPRQLIQTRSIKLRLTTVGVPSRWPHDTPLSTKVGGRTVGIVHSRTMGHGVCLFVCSCWYKLHDTTWNTWPVYLNVVPSVTARPWSCTLMSRTVTDTRQVGREGENLRADPPTQEQILWVLVRKWTIPTNGRRLSSNLVPTFTDRRCSVVGTTDLYGS